MIALLLQIALEPETGPFVGFKESYRELAAVARPRGVKKAPEGKLRWYAFPWGDGEAVIAVDGKRLWADTDGDGDLAEETPAACAESWSSPTQVKLPLKLVSRTIEATLQVRFSDGKIRLTNLTRMTAKVEVGDRKIAVSLNDYLTNGRYDDYFTTKTEEYWLCDHVHIDSNGDGRYADRLPPRGEDHYMAKAYILDGAVYGFEVLDRGERLRWAKRDTKLATVKVNVKSFTVAFDHDEYGLCHLWGEDGVGKLPEGRYVLNYYDYKHEGADVDGNVWQEDKVEPVEIKDGMELRLRQELRYELFCENQEGKWGLRTVCYGPFGERVEVTPKGADDNLKPTIRVTTRDGKELFSVESNYC
jgi:hypothetical protein